MWGVKGAGGPASWDTAGRGNALRAHGCVRQGQGWGCAYEHGARATGSEPPGSPAWPRHSSAWALRCTGTTLWDVLLQSYRAMPREVYVLVHDYLCACMSTWTWLGNVPCARHERPCNVQTSILIRPPSSYGALIRAGTWGPHNFEIAYSKEILLLSVHTSTYTSLGIALYTVGL